jgi:hypothetical protein
MASSSATTARSSRAAPRRLHVARCDFRGSLRRRDCRGLAREITRGIGVEVEMGGSASWKITNIRTGRCVLLFYALHADLDRRALLKITPRASLNAAASS